MNLTVWQRLIAALPDLIFIIRYFIERGQRNAAISVPREFAEAIYEGNEDKVSKMLDERVRQSRLLRSKNA